MAFSFDYSQSLINVVDQVTVDVQSLVDAIREEEASEEGIAWPSMLRSSGKNALGDNVSVGLTAELINNWQIRFADGNYIAKVSGGNLVGGIGGDPIAYSPGVQVLLIQSAASTVVSVGGSALTNNEHDKLMSLVNGLTDGQNTKLTAIHKSHMNRRKRDGVTGVITLYDDDGSTAYALFDSNEDLSEITPQ